VVTAGAQHALDLICRLLLDPGDVAWLEEPGSPGARAALAAAGADIHPVPVDEQGVVVPAGVAAAARPRLAYVTPSHHFPLGVQMTLSRRLSLLTLARELDTWIVEDDYDGEFRYGAQPVPCLHGIDADGRVIYVGSFSKTLFPALRIGYLIVPADLVDAVRAARRATDIHVPTLDQAVVAEFIEAGDYERHLRRMRQEYRGRRDALLAAAQRHCGGGLSVRPVATGVHAVADLCDGAAAAVSLPGPWRLTRGRQPGPAAARRPRARLRRCPARIDRGWHEVAGCGLSIGLAASAPPRQRGVQPPGAVGGELWATGTMSTKVFQPCSAAREFCASAPPYHVVEAPGVTRRPHTRCTATDTPIKGTRTVNVGGSRADRSGGVTRHSPSLLTSTIRTGRPFT
jgi:hypothetical protein